MFYNTKVSDLDLFGKNKLSEFANQGFEQS